MFILAYLQCEKKEDYIERIQTLDFDTKAAIAAHIQEVSDYQRYNMWFARFWIVIQNLPSCVCVSFISYNSDCPLPCVKVDPQS